MHKRVNNVSRGSTAFTLVILMIVALSAIIGWFVWTANDRLVTTSDKLDTTSEVIVEMKTAQARTEAQAQELRQQIIDLCGNKPQCAPVVDADEIRGPEGVPGEPGAQGPPGLQGPQGPQGIQGPQGERGPRGFQGLAGLIGLPGQDGQIGPTGPQGEKGPVGPEGPKGEKGEVGPQGPAGEPGPKGDTGLVNVVSDPSCTEVGPKLTVSLAYDPTTQTLTVICS